MTIKEIKIESIANVIICDICKTEETNMDFIHNHPLDFWHRQKIGKKFVDTCDICFKKAIKEYYSKNYKG